MDNTANLSLPYIMPSQAQKHVTHNEALRVLDALVQLSVESRARAAPPAAPSEGERYIVDGGGTGEWAGWDGDLAFRSGGGWMRFTPQPGWRAFVRDEAALCVFDGSSWTPLSGGASARPDMLGINAEADETNRLALASTASLFNHEGAGHQVKINKSAAGDTASFLFQTGFSGRAEMGTAGDDDFRFKVSPDGQAWHDAIAINRNDGKVSIGESFMNFSALNIKGRALTGTGSSWFGITVTQTDADNTAKGGAVLSGAPFANADKPFMVLGPWATSGAHVVYYGGGGWGCPEATEHRFYTGPYRPATDNTGTIAFQVLPEAIIAGRTLRPGTDNAFSLGAASQRFSVVHAATGTIATSDERLKEDVQPVPLGLDFLRELQPVAYRWKVGGYDMMRERITDPSPKGETAEEITIDTPVPRPGARIHYGLIAQQVKAALDAADAGDFAGWTLADRDDADSEQGLRYEQFVPILIRAVQELATEMEDLRAQSQATSSSPLPVS